MNAGPIWVGRSEPDCLEDEMADERIEQQEEAHASPGCCGHGSYAFFLVQGIRHARCQRCGHQWLVMLGGPDRRGYCEADGVQNDVPGIALR